MKEQFYKFAADFQDVLAKVYTWLGKLVAFFEGIKFNPDAE